MAESLYHAAVDLSVAPPETPGRAGRLWALARFAHRFAPGDGRVNRLLADIYLAQGRPDAETKAIEASLKTFPTDHLLWRHWMSLRMGPMQRAEDRAEFLAGLVARADLSAALRAEAEALRARVLHSQGLSQDAVRAARAAVDLDPNGPEPLTVWRELVDDANGPGRIEVRFQILKADPRAFVDAWALALELGTLGLHKEAMQFFDYARAAERTTPRVEELPLALQIPYCSAMLDAGRHREAIQVLEAVIRRHPLDANLKALLLEAYRKEGKDEKAAELIGYMEAAFEERASAGQTTRLLAERAWFHVDTKRSSQALNFATKAVQYEPDNTAYQRILAAAEMVFGDADRGEKALRGLLGKDAYASVLLAERFETKRNIPALREVVLKAKDLPRNGPAYRRLRVLAQKHGVVLPTPDGAPKAALMAEKFDNSRLRMFQEPEKYVAVEIKPAAESVLCGDAIEVLATLRNIAEVALPLGDRGLLNPRMAMTVSMGPKGSPATATASRLPLVVWPAPRYLGPGEALTTRVRLDLGEAAALLARRPLEDITLVVTGKLDPLPSGTSAVSGVAVAPARITRTGLLREFDRGQPAAWERAYKLALGRVVRDLRRGDLPARLRAARQVGALLSLATDVRDGRSRLPAPLVGKVDRLVVLAMLRAMLRDSSAAVRQEVIASLAYTRMGQQVIGLLAPLVEDPSPVVRCRLVEWLAGNRTRGCEAIVNLYASDDDNLVQAMAKAFQSR